MCDSHNKHAKISSTAILLLAAYPGPCHGLARPACDQCRLRSYNRDIYTPAEAGQPAHHLFLPDRHPIGYEWHGRCESHGRKGAEIYTYDHGSRGLHGIATLPGI